MSEFAFVAAQRFGGPLAARAALSLAQKVTFRWSVHRRVKKTTEFRFSGRAYKTWLKSITAAELEDHAGNAAPTLAVRLQESLSATSFEWAARDDAMTRVLQLVERTYPAIVAEMGQRDSIALREQWAQSRHDEVREALTNLVGPEVALGEADRAAVLLKWSAGRRSERLQAFELTEEDLAAHFEHIQIPEVPPSGLKVLTGDFGSGKSEVAEEWHRTQIALYRDTPGAPVPVWIRVRECAQRSLEETLDQLAGSRWRDGRGAAVVLDGLDESDAAVAQRMLEAARLVSLNFSGMRFLLTSRPGSVRPRDDEDVRVRALSEQEAMELVEMTGVGDHATHGWSEDLRTTVTRPFFALAAGVLIQTGDRPKTQTDLIRGLVERSLERGTEVAPLTNERVRSILERLAVSITRRSGDQLPFDEKQVARASRLVAERPDGSLYFALPIFQHWFAGQALIRGDVPELEPVSGSTEFGRWRWAATVAATSSAEARVDELFVAWVSTNPGAAAWIINEGFGATRLYSNTGEGLDAQRSGPRVLLALRTWSDALGLLAPGLLPHFPSASPAGLGFSVIGRRISIGLLQKSPSEDIVLDLPPEVHPWSAVVNDLWLPWMQGPVAEDHAWPWILVRDLVAGQAGNLFSGGWNLGAPDGVWAQELRYDLARVLLQASELRRSPLPRDRVQQAADQLLEIGERSEYTGFQLQGGRVVTGLELKELLDWIAGTDSAAIEAHLPENDIEHPASGWVQDFYTPARLQEFEVEVYGRACDAYDEARSNFFSTFGWSLQGSNFAPFGVLLEAEFADEEAPFGHRMTLSSCRVPMELLPELAGATPGSFAATNGRARIRRVVGGRRDAWQRFSGIFGRVEQWLDERDRSSEGATTWSTTILDQILDPRPASHIAAAWLWDDLNALGLTSGTFPRQR